MASAHRHRGERRHQRARARAYRVFVELNMRWLGPDPTSEEQVIRDRADRGELGCGCRKKTHGRPKVGTSSCKWPRDRNVGRLLLEQAIREAEDEQWQAHEEDMVELTAFLRTFERIEGWTWVSL